MVEVARVEACPVPAGCVAIGWIVAFDGDKRKRIRLGIGAVEVLDGEQGTDLVEATLFERKQCLLLHGEARIGCTEGGIVGGVHPVVTRRSDGDVARAVGIAEVQARRINLDGAMVAFRLWRAGERARLAVERSYGRACGVVPKALGGGHEAYLPNFALLVLSVVISRHYKRVVAVDERGAQFHLERISLHI